MIKKYKYITVYLKNTFHGNQTYDFGFVRTMLSKKVLKELLKEGNKYIYSYKQLLAQYHALQALK